MKLHAHIKIFLLFVCCSLTRNISCYTYNDAAKLKDTLLNTSRYDATLRPVFNQTKAIKLTSFFELLAIHGLDEVAESLKITASLDVFWRDEFLSWEPTKYGGADHIHLPQALAWKPDIALKNSLQQYKPLGDDSLTVAVSSDGRVLWKPLEVFLSTCKVDITKFPRDQHTCSLTFVTWGYSPKEVHLGGKGGVVTDDLEPNHAWEVISTEVTYSTSDYSDISFHITLLRKPTYSMLTLVLPVLILYILNLFVFALPSDCGEKSSYAVTVFLAFTVFLTIIDSAFPHNSEAVSYFAIFVICGNVQSTLITIVVLIMVRCASFDECKSIPKWLVAIARFRKCRCCRSNGVQTKVLPISSSDTQDTARSKSDSDKHDDKDGKVNEVYFTWKYCIDSLDAVFLSLFSSTFLLVSCIYFINIYI